MGLHDRARLADYLRTRRETRQPEDVGLPRGPRRRTKGLRREEVAVLSDMSIDYYTRLEQPRGPHPSEQMLGAIARGLRLSMEESDHLFELAGYATPRRVADSEHVNPGMRRIFDGLQDAAAQVVSGVGETVLQTRLSVALLGDESVHTGLNRSWHYRWFTDPRARLIYPEADHDEHSRMIVGDLLTAYTRKAPAIVEALLSQSPEFAALWKDYPVTARYCGPKRIVHPEVGLLELNCQRLVDPDATQLLVVYTAQPGSESHEKLELLSVIGASTATHGTWSS